MTHRQEPMGDFGLTKHLRSPSVGPDQWVAGGAVKVEKFIAAASLAHGRNLLDLPPDVEPPVRQPRSPQSRCLSQRHAVHHCSGCLVSSAGWPTSRYRSGPLRVNSGWDELIRPPAEVAL